MRRSIEFWLVGAACLLFLALAGYQIESPGLQADEVYFSSGIYEPDNIIYQARVFRRTVPLMLMSYLGCLKSWLYIPIFKVWTPSAASVRWPMLVAGAATIAVLALLLGSLAGSRAAVAVSVLLASDPSFLWTTRCDWGPTALQHLLSAGGVYALHRSRLAGAGVLFGLALWNKTTFAWFLPWLVILFFPRPLKPRSVATFLVAFLLGAYPWVRYNVSSEGETARYTAHFTPKELGQRTVPLLLAIEGGSLIGYMMREGPVGHPWPLRRNANLAVLGLALLATIALRSRLVLQWLGLWVASWVLMASTANGGESVHHIVLLWPWLYGWAALALAGASHRVRFGKWLLGGLLAVALCANILVVTHMHSALTTYGSDPHWSDAIYPLAQRIRREPPPIVYAHDWGIAAPLRVLTTGRIRFEETQDHRLEDIAGQPALFITHTDRFEAFAGANQRLRSIVGFTPRLLYTVSDSKGVEVFQVFRMEPSR